MRLGDLDALEKQFREDAENAVCYEERKTLEQCARDVMAAPTISHDSPRPKGQWVIKHRHRGGFRKSTGHDEYGVCLEEKQATSDWISVEEMLPVPYVNVLVTRKSLLGNYRFVGIECITYNHGEARVWGNDHKGWKTEVTHWMLLPELPKGETNDANL